MKHPKWADYIKASKEAAIERKGKDDMDVEKRPSKSTNKKRKPDPNR